MKRPRVGFAGVGWIGRHRLEAVAPLVEVVAVADPLATNREAALVSAPRALSLGSFEELLEQELDALVIATPSALHARQAVAALERGLSVFCQKPVGRNAAEAEAVVSTARRANKLLGADLSYRHTTAFRSVRELTKTGELGEVFAARFVFHNAYGPDKTWFYDRALSGGGCLIDLGTHLVDLALWLLPDAQVKRVECQAFTKGERARRTGAVEDHVAAFLEFDTGANVQLACSWGAHAGQEAVIEAELFGTRGGASVRNVGGSFYDFTASWHRRTSRHSLCEPPDAWGGRAICRWAERLNAGQHFDPECESLIELSRLIDQLYERGLQ